MTWPLQTDQGMPVAKIELNALQIGWLMGGLVWDRSKEGDPIARSLYLRLKAAAIACGVDWYYDDPWEVTDGSGNPIDAGVSEPEGGER